MEKDQGIEKQEYSDDRRPDEVFSAVTEIVRDMERASPSCGIRVKFNGDLMILSWHSTVSFLPGRMQDIEKDANDALNKALSHIKKEFRAKTKSKFEPVEKRDRRDHSIEKTSLNQRYYVSFWRSYTFDS